MARWVLTLLLFCVLPANAQTINRCVHPKTGAVAFSSSPCPTTVAGWQAEFERAGNPYDRDVLSADEAQARIEQARRAIQQAARQALPAAAGAGAMIDYSSNGKPRQPETLCEHAKAQRDALRKQSNLSYDMRVWLDHQMWEACRDQGGYGH